MPTILTAVSYTHLTFSNSAWGWENFYLTSADVNDPAIGESGWNFQGFIYRGDFGKNNNNNDDNGNDTITYKTGVYEVEVSDYLNMRAVSYTHLIFIKKSIIFENTF